MRKAILLGAMVAGLAVSAHAEYAIGETPPDFTCDTTLPGEFGAEWNLYEHRGQVVLINFGATW